ncbi:diguanylate cyclase/phosphodiesterase (GGDEF & EAL domains) with PAS/PAC sensor(s) [hydrothermal vent metagenome]|uniref:Diguanylate cyclase/phosphodiesterase (GGDEF & EAL domains) with PAS/PAC sensor(S) n=1 Tax=hydrothermal vent metagenome TaxID=652676 RepID=A0A3B0YU20_9ZZZZ
MQLTQTHKETRTLGLLALQAEILESIATSQPRDQVLDQLCQLSEEIVGECVASVMLYNQSKTLLNIIAAPNLPREALEALDGTIPGKGAGSCSNAVLTGKPAFVCNALSDDRWNEIQHIAKKLKIGACWSFPIYIHGEITGSFSITSFRSRTPSELYQKLLKISAHLAGIAIERAKNDEILNHSNTAFNNTSEAILISDITGSIFRSNNAYHAISGFEINDIQNLNIFEILATNKHLTHHIKSSLKKIGTWRGEVKAHKKSEETFPALLNINTVYNNQGQAHQYVAVLSDISLLKESENKLSFLAHHDTLTKLPNRFAFEKILKDTLKNKCTTNTPIAILYIDLDNFKTINDTRGHAVGDKFLKMVATRLFKFFQKTDFIARVGGDEFTIMCCYQQVEEIRIKAKKLLKELSRIYSVDNNDYYSSASIGIALAPADGKTIESLIKCADTAMYKAKKLGKDQFFFYTESLTLALQTRMEMEVCLRQAISKNELFIEYQPLYKKNREIVSVEALLRWQSPKFGLVPPETFITLAEESGLIVSIGLWALKTSCQQANNFIINTPGLKLSVNLSRFQLKDVFMNSLISILEETGFDPNRLEFEITESTMLSEFSNNRDLLLKVNKMGIKLSIDDFGTGYSSLSDLKNLPVQSLKIDKSLIDDLPGNAAISNAVVAMGNALGLTVVAEGVENDLQFDCLISAGCDYFQGFLLSTPLSLANITHKLNM